MNKLILKNNSLKSLNESHNLGDLQLDLKQFRIPSAFVVLKNEIKVRVEKEKNLNGELVETGKYSIDFPVRDQQFIELLIANNSTEIGNPINIIVENQDSIPNTNAYADEDEFIPISFGEIRIIPKKVLKKVYTGGKSVDAWVFDDIKITADTYSIGNAGKTNEK